MVSEEQKHTQNFNLTISKNANLNRITNELNE